MSDSHSSPLEHWVKVNSHRSYEVSNLGRVKSPRGILKPAATSKYGHLQIQLYDNGTRTVHYVHQLVARAFIGPQPHDRPFVCHKDGNPRNNRVDNLYFGTYETNSADRVTHGRGAHRLSEKEVIEIQQSTEVAPVLAKRYGIGKGTIHAIRQGRIWKHTGQPPKQVGKARPGSANGCAKLTESQIQEIRDSKLAQTKLAAMYGISQSAVSNIKRGAAWASVSGGTAVKGTAHVRKLNEDIVRAIRADTRTQKEIAAAYGLAQATVGEIKRRQIWKHVE